MFHSSQHGKADGRIGLVDECLGNFHSDVYLDAIRGPLAERGLTISGATALERDSGRAWAKKNQVPFFEDVDALDSAVDYYMILAPSNPACHLSLCEQVFPHGKTTYVDKTFAPDLATAKKIFQLADHYQVAVQTSSALRYTEVQAVVRKRMLSSKSPVCHLAVWGGGTSLEEYAIHPLELAVSCLGAGADALLALGDAEHPHWVLRYGDGHLASIDFNAHAHVPYAAAVTTAQGTEWISVDDSHLFIDAASAILDFFTQGEAQIDRQESLLIRSILDRIQAHGAQGEFVPIGLRRSGVPKPHGHAEAAQGTGVMRRADAR